MSGFKKGLNSLVWTKNYDARILFERFPTKMINNFLSLTYINMRHSFV